MTGMALRGIVGCVPSAVINNETDYPWFSAADIRKVAAMAGVKFRRRAGDGICTSDLCHAAAAALLRELDWDPKSVDVLILLTQTPDYVMPSTSCVLQQRLGLADSCAAFDVGLGCSAYVYGLWLANALISAGAARRIVLLAGETPSKIIDPTDRATALLFGDAGTATALERTEVPESKAHYIMMTDGSGADALIVQGGMFRNRFPADQRDYCVRMDGMRLFEFTRKRVPTMINDLLLLASKTPQDYGYFVFHQANEYMIKFLAAKAGVALSQVPLVLERFGNTGAASVPLTLASVGPPTDCGETYDVMLLGFGVGLSWGGVSLRLHRASLLAQFEYPE
jgi:3-oxoacyl-[acyl-carrier-protein] synthase III